jgi:ubiquinone biosynthesis protein UbiJ
MISQLSAASLNHLLKQNSWALSRLERFAGKTARFDIAPISFVWSIQADGSLRCADENISADVVCILSPSLLPRLALHDENAYAEIRSTGDPDFLKEIFFLSRNLSWDAAEDLSKFTGDIPAERIVQALQSLHQQFYDSVTNLSQAATEYFTEEQPLVAKPLHVSEFIQQVDMLRDDIARLEQRIKALTIRKNG